MKYRIREIIDGSGDCNFYPQYMNCLVWRHFTEDIGCEIQSMTVRIKFNTIEEARDFIKRQKRIDAKDSPQSVKYHEV